jgi:hypothetical protein
MDPMSHGSEQFEYTTETISTPRRPRWRVAAAAATGSAAVAGIVAVGVLTGGSGSGASAGATATTTTTPQRPRAEARADARSERLSQELQPLVDKGTITDAQRDAVVKQLLESKGPAFGHGDRTFPGRPGGPIRAFLGAGLDTAAKALGMSTADLRTALRDGSSIADVAKQKGVDVDKVIDALVAEAKSKLAGHDLPGGRTPPTDAQIRQAITRAVNGQLRFGFRGHRPGDGPPPMWPGAPGKQPAAPPTSAPPTTAPATTAPPTTNAPTTTEAPATTTTGG